MAALFVLNLFLGWMLVGWVVSLVWALTDANDARNDARRRHHNRAGGWREDPHNNANPFQFD